MAKTTATRDAILTAGLELLLRKGFAGSGLSELLREAGVPKGSFYHYFPGGKEALALAVVEMYIDGATDARRAALSKEGAPLERLRGHFEQMAEAFAAQRWENGCLLGNLAGEAAEEHPSVRNAVYRGFEFWVADLERVLAEAADETGLRLPAAPQETARLLVAGWEGAAIMMKSERRSGALDEFINLWFDVVFAR